MNHWFFVAILPILLFIEGDMVHCGEKPLIPRSVIMHGYRELFPVHGADREWMEETIIFYLPINKDLSVREKFESLCEGLSRYLFDSLPVKLEKIEKSGGKNIAVIGLYEGKRNKSSWRTGFFQGSTGGGFTSLSLKETLLQSGYHGEWVDAVRFEYEGEAIQPGIWDHIFLDGLFHRESLNK